jgi:hypothetical protein
MEPFSLMDDHHVRQLIGVLRKIPDLGILILDPMGGFTGGTSLDMPTPATKIVTAMKRIDREAECFVLGVHHTGHDEKRMRGAKALFDLSDTVIRCGNGEITCEKSKEGDLFEPIGFELKPVYWVDPNKPKSVKFDPELHVISSMAAVPREIEDEEMSFLKEEQEDTGPRKPPQAVPPQMAGVTPLIRPGTVMRGASRAGRDIGRTGLRDASKALRFLGAIIVIIMIVAGAVHQNASVNNEINNQQPQSQTVPASLGGS